MAAENEVGTMKTSVFLDPDNTHERIAELKQARSAYAAAYPDASPGHFSHRGESWNETVNGYCFSIDHSIRDLPLFLRGIPIHAIELTDSVEDPHGIGRLTCGVYETDSTRAEVDSYLNYTKRGDPFFIYTIKIQGGDLGKVNDLYTKIRQSRATPTHLWDVVAPNS